MRQNFQGHSTDRFGLFRNEDKTPWKDLEEQNPQTKFRNCFARLSATDKTLWFIEISDICLFFHEPKIR